MEGDAWPLVYAYKLLDGGCSCFLDPEGAHACDPVDDPVNRPRMHGQPLTN
jgi:hypothetical protein